MWNFEAVKKQLTFIMGTSVGSFRLLIGQGWGNLRRRPSYVTPSGPGRQERPKVAKSRPRWQVNMSVAAETRLGSQWKDGKWTKMDGRSWRRRFRICRADRRSPRSMPFLFWEHGIGGDWDTDTRCLEPSLHCRGTLPQVSLCIHR